MNDTRISTNATPYIDVVRQEDIQAVIDKINESQRLAAEIRRRLAAGAFVEPGKWVIDGNAGPSLDWYKQNGRIGDSSGVATIVGLEIGRSESASSVAAVRR